MARTEVQGPARPRRLTVAIERSGDRLALRYRSREWGRGGFMLLWLIGWTVGCVFLAGMVLQQPQLSSILFAIPFWASWLFVFCMVVKAFFQRDELQLDCTGATYARRVLFPLASRAVPLGELQSFEQYTTTIDSESGQCQSGIEIRTLGLPIRLAQGLSGPELDWLQFQLNDHLEMLRGMRLARAPGRRETEAASGGPADPEASETITVLSAATVPVSPPSDCCWVRLDGFDHFGFARRGRLGCGSVLGLAFVNAFWNGVVSVFVLGLCGGMPGGAPQGAMWWGMLVFLIPFEVIGLVMFAALLASLLEPVHRTTWIFTRNGVERRHTWLGIGPCRTWDFISLDRIELWWDAKREGSPLSFRTDPDSGGRWYRLSLVDRDNAEVCSIEGLTEGEARWIGDSVLRERAAWFR